MKYLGKQSFSYPTRPALDLLLLLLSIATSISIRTREVVEDNGKGRSLRRVIEVVKKGGALGVMGFAATRRPTASNERLRTIVVESIMKRLVMMMLDNYKSTG